MRYVDNFYDNPYQVQKQILELPFAGVPGDYTGFAATEGFQDIENVMDRIAVKLGRSLQYPTTHQGGYRTLTEEQYEQKTYHVHVDRMGISGVLCFNDAYPGGTTSLYRHKETGLTSVKNIWKFRRVAKKKKMTSQELISYFKEEGKDLSKWELLEEVEYKFNRLIVFDTDFFHLAGAGKGTDLSSCKITQLFNFLIMPKWGFLG